VQKRPVIDPLDSLDLAFREIHPEKEAIETPIEVRSTPLDVFYLLAEIDKTPSSRTAPVPFTPAEPEKSSSNRSAPLPRDPLEALRTLEKPLSESSAAGLSPTRGDDGFLPGVDPLKILRGLEQIDDGLAAELLGPMSTSEQDPDPSARE
jgi:hypothetical protein